MAPKMRSYIVTLNEGYDYLQFSNELATALTGPWVGAVVDDVVELESDGLVRLITTEGTSELLTILPSVASVAEEEEYQG